MEKVTSKDILDSLKMLSRQYDTMKIIQDVCYLTAATISQNFNYQEERRQECIRIKQHYDESIYDNILQLSGKIIKLCSGMYDNGFQDYLGEIYMQYVSKSSQNARGIFFTPYHVARFMAEITLDKSIKKDFITIGEPCCGSGVLMLAALDVMKNSDFNYTNNALIVAQDITPICVHMCYIQLSCAGAAAVVKQGNSLEFKVYDEWFTPAFMLQRNKFIKAYHNLKD